MKVYPKISIALMIITLASPVIAKEKIELMFPKPTESNDRKTGALYGTGPTEKWLLYRVDGEKKEIEYEAVALEKFIDLFKEYKVERIEVWVEGRTESKGITKLFISIGGAGGVRLTLVPK
jgi:hypothetical protein